MELGHEVRLMPLTYVKAYASDLEPFIADHEIAAWVHRHIHESRDYRVAGTRIVSNPYGYQIEERNPDFNPDFTLEV